jgi:hypothetical protein
MKKYGMLAAVAAILSISAGAWAAFSQDVFVSSIEVDSLPGPGANTVTSTYLRFATPPNNKTACSSPDQSVIDGPAEHVRSVTALTTAAMLAGKKVNVLYGIGCFTVGSVSYSKITNVNVTQ